MIFGIDIARYQLGLDINLVRVAGDSFVGVKAVAGDQRQHAVAVGYQNNIDRVIAAGFDKAKFHYAVPNSENTPAVLAKFVFENRYRAAPTDAYMLDNEPLDTYKVFWRDDNAAAYFEALHVLGIRYDQMWLYCPAALTRAAKYWPKIIELRKKGLKIVWVSYGDNDPHREDGEEPFTGETGLDDPELHQFTSTYRVPGYDGNIDRNWSRLSLAELFNEGGATIMQNPWGRVTGTWEDHASYSEGGTDYPLGYGTALRAPASGNLVNNGWVGSAGRRATFYFDQAVKRVVPPSRTRMLGGYVEHNCDMTALVFQHAKGYLGNAHFAAGALIGYSGASANGVDYGGDVHLHIHGQCIHGARVDFMKFIGSGTAGGGTTPIEEDILSALSDQEQKDLYNDVKNIAGYLFRGGSSVDSAVVGVDFNAKSVLGRVNNLEAATFHGGPSMQDGGKSISQSLAEINAGGGVVDIDALATAIAAKIPAGAAVDPVAIAKAVRSEFKANPLT